jgi:hypothetical protein
VLTFVSEVSGFADLLYVFIGFFLSKWYTPKTLEATLLKNMRPVDHDQKQAGNIDFHEPMTLKPETVKKILFETKKRF